MSQEIRARYWNSNGYGVAIVASVSIWGKDKDENEVGDWAAYIGADDGWSASNCLNTAAKTGAKLSESDARHFFPGIKLPYRR